MKKRNIKYCLLFFGISLFFASPARAEIIDKFDSYIRIKQDSSLSITETIIIDFGSLEKHGIFRDIPVKYATGYGNYSIKIQVKSVRDENDRPYEFEEIFRENDKRIKIGDENVTVSGKTTYVIDYDVSGAMNFLDGHDELYWNVSGEKWPFEVKNITAAVLLPVPLDESEVRKECFAGEAGIRTKCDKANFLVDNSKAKEARFAQGSLGPYEGLTVVVGIPKGLVALPKVKDKIRAILYDNVILGLPLLVLAGFIYLWRREGKDPRGKGVIIHHYGPPEGLSPAEVGVIKDEMVDDYDISADIIDLAVKGYLRIAKTQGEQLIFKKDDYSLAKLKPSGQGLASKSQVLLFEKLFYDRPAGLPAENQDGALAAVKLSELKDKFHKDLAEIKKSVYADITARGYFNKNPEKVRNAYLISGIALIMAAFLLGGAFGIYTAVSIGLSGLIALVFSFLMPQRSTQGVIAKEHIEGFKTYLSVAEKDRIDFHNAPEKDPQLFEKYLPYAMALKVEKAWARQFENIYRGKPDWYRDPGADYFTPAVFAASLSGFTSEAKTALASSPSSAASGGSGFSGGGVGGGFGGGGGGSW